MPPCSMATASLFSGGCLLCMHFGSKLLELHVDTSWLYFVAVVNFIISENFSKQKILFYLNAHLLLSYLT